MSRYVVYYVLNEELEFKSNVKSLMNDNCVGKYEVK